MLRVSLRRCTVDCNWSENKYSTEKKIKLKNLFNEMSAMGHTIIAFTVFKLHLNKKAFEFVTLLRL